MAQEPSNADSVDSVENELREKQDFGEGPKVAVSGPADLRDELLVLWYERHEADSSIDGWKRGRYLTPNEARDLAAELQNVADEVEDYHEP